MEFFRIIFAMGFMVFFLGLIYSFIKKRKKKPWIIGTVTCFMLFSIVAEPPQKATKDQPVVQNEQQAPIELTVEEKIEKICKDELKDNFITVEISNNVTIADGKSVFVSAKGIEGLSNSMTRKVTLNQSSLLLQKIYTSGLPIGKCRILSSLPLTDKYGKSEDGVVMKCTLDADVAQKINWDKSAILKWESILNEYWEHPAFKR